MRQIGILYIADLVRTKKIEKKKPSYLNYYLAYAMIESDLPSA